MNFRFTSVKQLISLLLTIIFLLGITGCSPQPASKTGEAAIEPQSGEWMAEFSVELKNGKTENWEVYFDVSEDGKTVPNVRLVYYTGDWTPDTQAQALFSIQGNPAIENNTFGFSLTEMASYTTYTYKGSVTFTSSKEAEGTINVYGDDYQFTASPVTE